MKCFEHADNEAVGLCTACQRGVCHACANERPGGLACRDRCEARVDAMHSIMVRDLQLALGALNTSRLAPFLTFIAAAGSIYFAFETEYLPVKMSVFASGLFMLYLTVSVARAAWSKDKFAQALSVQTPKQKP